MESGTGIRTPTQAIKILALLIESGAIYILIGVSSTLAYYKRGLSRSLFSLQFSSLVTMTICFLLGLSFGDVYIPVGIQLAVRSQLLRNYPHGFNFVIWRLGNVPNGRGPTHGEKPLVQLWIYFV